MTAITVNVLAPVWTEWYNTKSRTTQFFITLIPIILGAISIAVFPDIKNLGDLNNHIFAFGAFVMLYAFSFVAQSFIVAPYLFNQTDEDPLLSILGFKFRSADSIAYYFGLLGCMIIFGALMIIYAFIPQELGGGAPKCGEFFLRAEQLPEEIAKDLALDGDKIRQDTFLSKKLFYVTVPGNTTTILKKDPRSGITQVVTLKGEAVAGWRSCDASGIESILRILNETIKTVKSTLRLSTEHPPVTSRQNESKKKS
jgi:hypothetical protein